jgi:hypothetical protein
MFSIVFVVASLNWFGKLASILGTSDSHDRKDEQDDSEQGVPPLASIPTAHLPRRPSQLFGWHQARGRAKALLGRPNRFAASGLGMGD